MVRPAIIILYCIITQSPTRRKGEVEYARGGTVRVTHDSSIEHLGRLPRLYRHTDCTNTKPSRAPSTGLMERRHSANPIETEESNLTHTDPTEFVPTLLTRHMTKLIINSK